MSDLLMIERVAGHDEETIMGDGHMSIMVRTAIKVKTPLA